MTLRVINVTEDTKNVLVTTAIGKTYLRDWEQFSLPSWQKYAEKYQLGIACVTEDLLEKDDPHYKNGSWQKLLAPSAVLDEFPQVERFCLLDTDIQIGPFAPDIFANAPEGVYSVVSQLKGLPFPLDEVLRRMAFFRNHFYSNSYPLDSFLLGDVFDEFRDLGLTPPEDYFCAGLMVLDRNHVEQMRGWFYEVKESQNFHGWEQTHLNFWIQSQDHHWLPYEYQALWNYEMAWKYPYLYSAALETPNREEVRAGVESSLWNNHFLHFAGSWYESLAWKLTREVDYPEFSGLSEEFSRYLELPVTGKKFGQVFPGNSHSSQNDDSVQKLNKIDENR
jgi:hypothetical protein